MIAETIARLTAEVPGLKLVAGASQFQAAAEAAPTATPAAFVLLLGESPRANELANFVAQRVEVQIGVVYALRNVADPKGAAAGTDLETLRAAGQTALLGWQPTAAHDPLERGPGALLAFKEQVMWWQDIYTTAFYITA